ncbi:hypothetical protein TPHA_0A05250 [Tetrapisispora phaffii CBS 4417]|uniref:HSF-type DNA-binding domain-containing protein n=1 Tax=Tetrapisispora phaffii (strain ATCC 24235 / CBS 4417 / NBRC 1672 / NRRL Y-8282 / UCD 70-5) TaxID=1071381 RepID=G8BNX2_TETPH|nr:hypothetical protein TPHA_0A05250 [Tetrapisispora phaffii CBS 4417]CCE61600.1 hypothetical protein TPHA_0A05250 [Tetrapisispora phaffii CBS 4417]
MKVFIHQLYSILDQSDLREWIHWIPDADGVFAIKPFHHNFSQKVLQKYFKHKNFTSFVRQLYMYGFHKLSPNKNVIDSKASLTSNTGKTSQTNSTSAKDSNSRKSNSLSDKSKGNSENAKNGKEDIEWYFTHPSGLFHKGSDVVTLNKIQRKGIGFGRDGKRKNILTRLDVCYIEHPDTMHQTTETNYGYNMPNSEDQFQYSTYEENEVRNQSIYNMYNNNMSQNSDLNVLRIQNNGDNSSINNTNNVFRRHSSNNSIYSNPQLAIENEHNINVPHKSFSDQEPQHVTQPFSYKSDLNNYHTQQKNVPSSNMSYVLHNNSGNNANRLSPISSSYQSISNNIKNTTPIVPLLSRLPNRMLNPIKPLTSPPSLINNSNLGDNVYKTKSESSISASLGGSSNESNMGHLNERSSSYFLSPYTSNNIKSVNSKNTSESFKGNLLKSERKEKLLTDTLLIISTFSKNLYEVNINQGLNLLYLVADFQNTIYRLQEQLDTLKELENVSQNKHVTDFGSENLSSQAPTASIMSTGDPYISSVYNTNASQNSIYEVHSYNYKLANSKSPTSSLRPNYFPSLPSFQNRFEENITSKGPLINKGTKDVFKG